MVKELKGQPSIGTTFKRGLDVYKKNFVPIFVATLLALVIGGVSCGICSAPLLCGVLAMILAVMRNGDTKLEIGDVFKGFQKFAPAFVSALVIGLINFVVCTILGLIPILGIVAVIVIGYVIVPAVLTWALFLVTDQDATIGEAITVPLKLLRDKRFWNIILVVFVASLAGSVGAVACGIGLFVTLPFAYCMIAAAYEEVYSGSAPAEAAAPEAPATAETPAS